MRPIALFLLLISSLFLKAQHKTTIALKVVEGPKLDGLLDDQVWANAPVASDFILNQPAFGNPAAKKTSVKILYDNAALYVGAQLYDDPSRVRRQLTARDEHDRADADHFAVFLDTYKDQQNGFQFLVTSRNVQSDARLSPLVSGDWGNYGDKSWDAVWDSRVSFNKEGWSVEIRIPYSAIRFSKEKMQTWGIQFLRFDRIANETSFWNPVNPAVNGFVNQFGILDGLTDLSPPLRLSFSPYVSGGYRSNTPNEKGEKQVEWLRSGGMDLKWGINESFTLDATLIPDFGQVISDNKINNLTPFDIQFQENRPFFTEGTELFNKAGIFYSRRVGRTPGRFAMISETFGADENYTIKKNPAITPLFNAIKFSGRNKHNLGIGIFNAVAQPVDAIIRNEISGNDSIIRTEHLSNYNIIVLDKALRNRSYISFTNTNVWRSGSSPDANVSAIDLGLYTPDNRYSFLFKPRFSKITGANGREGWANNISFGKVSGRWQWSLSNTIESDLYDPNDLGFLPASNEITTALNLSYNIFTPTEKFIQQRYRFTANHTSLFKPFGFQEARIKTTAFWWFKNFWDLTVEITATPTWYNDYFELRSGYKLLRRPSWAFIGLSGSSDSRKRLYGYWSAGFAESKDIYNDMFLKYSLGLRYRFSDKLSMEISNAYQNDNGQFGSAFEKEADGRPIIAFRQNLDVTTILSGIYNFAPRMNMTVRGRHYWNKVTNHSFHSVTQDGNWTDRPFIEGRDLNVNIFNLDIFYVWDFRLGSRIIAGWKNWIDPDYSNDLYSRPGYGKNLSHIMGLDHGNEFTLKFIYYLDYQDLRKKRS